MSQLAIFLFGPPRIALNSEFIHISRRKAMALLAYLAVNGQPHSRDALGTLLWPENDHSSARGRLRRTLSSLHRALGAGWLVADRETVCLKTHPDPGEEMVFWLDVADFQSKLKAVEDHNHPSNDICEDCIRVLEEAVKLYTDDFMAGFSLKDCPAFDDWQFFEREALRSQLAGILDNLSIHFSTVSEHKTAIQFARRWLAIDPLHEPAHQRLMDLYEISGQHTAALRQYETCRQVLADELGVEPSQATRDLYNRIRFTPLSSLRLSRPKSNLPAQTTPFIGREAELSEIKARLKSADCRLLTLLGPGGSGKTRLAIETGKGLLDDFKHGVFFINLAPIQEQSFIPSAIAQAIHYPLQEGGTPEEQILEYLLNKEMLLILDNFEQLIPGAQFVNQIIQAASRVKVLATSRTSLAITGEYLYTVMGMAYPETIHPQPGTSSKYSAIQLFESGAKQRQPSFELTDENLPNVIQICALIEGMPLGIVLAASWVRMLTPAEIAEEIARDLAFLDTELQDVPKRQQSLRSVFNHSWQLLSQSERRIMKSLSVFRGGFTREAAQTVADAPLGDLLGLIDKSILHRTATGRFEIHELLLQYAAEKLSSDHELEAYVREGHSSYYCQALVEWERALQGENQKTARQEVLLEIDNIRRAWDWAVDNSRWKTLLAAINGLGQLLVDNQQPIEGEKIWSSLDEKLIRQRESLKSPPSKLGTETLIDILKLQARNLVWRCRFANWQGNSDHAYKLGQECLAILEGRELADQETRFEKAHILFMFSFIQKKFAIEEQIHLAKQAAQLFNALNAQYWEEDALHVLGLHLESISQTESIIIFKRCLEINRKLGNLIGIVASLEKLSWLAAARSQFEKAEELLQEALVICKDLDEYHNLVNLYGDLGIQWVWAGRFQEARTLFQEVRTTYHDLDYRYSHAALIHIRPVFADMHLGNYQAARNQTQHALDLFQEHKFFYTRTFSLTAIEILGSINLVERSFNKASERFQECLQVTHLTDGVGKARACLGYAARGLKEASQARSHFWDALALSIQATRFLPLIYTIPGIALLYIDQGKVEQAVELYALASKLDIVANSKWFAGIAGDEIAAVAQKLPACVVKAAKARGRAQDLWETGQKLLEELEKQGWKRKALDGK